jgi:peptidoglycan/LPS O-acetylase OafA/YrhL
MALHKILKLVALLLGVVALVMGIWLFSTGNQSLVQPLMYIAYAVFLLTVLFVVIFVLKGLFSGNLKNTLITVGAFLAVVVVAYLISNGVETPMKDGEMLSASGSKWVGTGLYTFYFLAIIAIGTMIVTGAKKIFK